MELSQREKSIHRDQKPVVYQAVNMLCNAIKSVIFNFVAVPFWKLPVCFRFGKNLVKWEDISQPTLKPQL